MKKYLIIIILCEKIFDFLIFNLYLKMSSKSSTGSYKKVPRSPRQLPKLPISGLRSPSQISGKSPTTPNRIFEFPEEYKSDSSTNQNESNVSYNPDFDDFVKASADAKSPQVCLCYSSILAINN